MACKVYSAAFTLTDGAPANIVLVQDVKADLDEMYTEFASGKMTIPDLGRTIVFSHEESPRRVWK